MAKSDRRQFLKNTSLATIGVGIAPKILNANSKSSEKDFSGGCDPTTQDLYGEGPFYTENPPELKNGQLASQNEEGIKLVISGRVSNLACSEFIENVIIDVWHADDAGDYDNEGFNLRGKTTTNSEGFYLFETIKPGKYLNGNQYRPSHIHFKITPPESPTLTTQLYFEGDEDIPTDAAASLTSGVYNAVNRIIPLTDDGAGGLEGTWDIVTEADETNSIHNIYHDKGMIYKAFPTPFHDQLTINYGVFKAARVSLMVFDLNGNQVAILEEQDLRPEKYSATWKPETDLPDGHYFISLKINDLQVHYLKVQKASLGYGY